MGTRTRWIAKHGVLAVVGAAACGTLYAGWLWGLGSPGDRGRAVQSAELFEIPTEGLPRKGADEDDTRVEMLMCSDFECPYSRRASGTVDELIAKNDDLAFFHVAFPLGFRHGRLKAIAAVAADRQGEFWPMHDALYGVAIESEDEAIELARRIGLDAERFAEDLRDPASAAEVDRQRSLCEGVGVRAVPTFFINGRRVVGALPVDQLQRVIDDERK